MAAALLAKKEKQMELRDLWLGTGPEPEMTLKLHIRKACMWDISHLSYPIVIIIKLYHFKGEKPRNSDVYESHF